MPLVWGGCLPFPVFSVEGGKLGVFLSGIIALGIPNALIGGCGVETIACHRVAFPAVSIISIVLLVYSAILIMVYNKNESISDPEP